MFHNVVVGKPIVDADSLIALDKTDWEENEKKNTLFTETRWLPAIMKEAGIVGSTGEVKRNKQSFVLVLINWIVSILNGERNFFSLLLANKRNILSNGKYIKENYYECYWYGIGRTV